MNRFVFVSGVAAAAALFPLSVEAASFSSFTVFGDSLSDSGNLFSQNAPLGFGFPPSPPYNQRFSDGLLWVDIVQQELGLSPVLVTALAQPLPPAQLANGINFAIAGATSSNVEAQVDAFIASGLPVDPTGLFSVWAGSNDYIDILDNPTVSPTDIPEQATDTIISSIVKLAGLGAKTILVPNIPQVGSLPFARAADAANPELGIASLLNALSIEHNTLLANKLDTEVRAKFEDVNVVELDIEGLIAGAIADPAAFGFTDVENTCLENFQSLSTFPFFQFSGVCENPDEFLFWDDVHPTEAAHKVVAAAALEALDGSDSNDESVSTPEPSVAFGALVAFGLTGLARRRQRVSSEAVKSAA